MNAACLAPHVTQKQWARFARGTSNLLGFPVSRSDDGVVGFWEPQYIGYCFGSVFKSNCPAVIEEWVVLVFVENRDERTRNFIDFPNYLSVAAINHAGVFT